MTTDNFGREYAKLTDLEPGHMIRLDDGFTCRPPGLVSIDVERGGRLYFLCSEGKHYLDGQADLSGYLIGIYK